VYVHSSAAICSALRASGAQCRSPGDEMLCCGSDCLSTNAASAAAADMPASVSTWLALQLLTSRSPCCVLVAVQSMTLGQHRIDGQTHAQDVGHPPELTSIRCGGARNMLPALQASCCALLMACCAAWV
jgi:hypothetical protein